MGTFILLLLAMALAYGVIIATKILVVIFKILAVIATCLLFAFVVIIALIKIL